MRYLAAISTGTLAIVAFRFAGFPVDWPSYYLGAGVMLIWELCVSWSRT